MLFFWQLPHFIAIAIFRQEEYTRAGIKVLPAVRGLRVAKVHAVVHSLLLLAVTAGARAAARRRACRTWSSRCCSASA